LRLSITRLSGEDRMEQPVRRSDAGDAHHGRLASRRSEGEGAAVRHGVEYFAAVARSVRGYLGRALAGGLYWRVLKRERQCTTFTVCCWSWAADTMGRSEPWGCFCVHRWENYSAVVAIFCEPTDQPRVGAAGRRRAPCISCRERYSRRRGHVLVTTYGAAAGWAVVAVLW
jgi:hypothetical protein